jgi:hypothetical protein
MHIALCLEELAPRPGSSRYLTCVAIRGTAPGLGVDREGEVRWQCAAPLACELWVSSDDQLILRRPSGAPCVRVERAGRSIEAPFDKPVVLLDQDVFETVERRFRVHLHGATNVVAAPAPYVQRRAAGRLATTLAIGVATLSCNKVESCAKRVIEVRTAPPEVAMPHDPDASALAPTDAPPEADDSDAAIDELRQAEASDTGGDAPFDARESGKRDAVRNAPPIEIRHTPPSPMPNRDR